MSSTCKGCGARIVWMKMAPKDDGTPGGAMPCDPEWKFGDGKKNLIVLDEDSRGHLIVKAEPGVLGREPHWGSCPAREQFKAKKQQISLF